MPEADTEADRVQKLAAVLPIPRSQGPSRLKDLVQDYLIFNAREQKFVIRRGISNADVKTHLMQDENMTKWRNCFEMSSARGNFRPNASEQMELSRGRFTPQFYPRRFCLKDDMYSQHPKILSRLLKYVIDRYVEAGVGYVELSIGVGDLIERPWLYPFLAGPVVEAEARIDVRFLAAFARTGDVKLPMRAPMAEGVRIMSSKGRQRSMFRKHIDRLERIKAAFALSRSTGGLKKIHETCVGLDYCGDEWKRPFCPFNLPSFIEFLRSERELRSGQFGFRYHCGECDQHARTDVFNAHMGITGKVIIDILSAFPNEDDSLPPPLRIGHGIAFLHFLEDALDVTRASSDATVLHSWTVRALHLIQSRRIPVEINLTSNEFLLFAERGTMNLFLRKGIRVILATDNDGIWSVESGGFKSVAAEYYGAIRGDLGAKGDGLSPYYLTQMIDDSLRAKFTRAHLVGQYNILRLILILFAHARVGIGQKHTVHSHLVTCVWGFLYMIPGCCVYL